jgi:hypothetical protein
MLAKPARVRLAERMKNPVGSAIGKNAERLCRPERSAACQTLHSIPTERQSMVRQF